MNNAVTGTPLVITLTGGEGGGNAIGRESGPALGLIRQEEERRSLAIIGVASPQFIGLQDFYFTLSAEEVQKHWGDTWLCDVVRRVRLTERLDVQRGEGRRTASARNTDACCFARA